MRNFIYIHALENNLPPPIGTQDASLFDTRGDDADHDPQTTGRLFEDDQTRIQLSPAPTAASLANFAAEAATGYQLLRSEHRNLFDWLRHDVFTAELADHLRQDAERLFSILQLAGEWQPDKDHKLAELYKLLAKKHPGQKVLIFSQFADTVLYLTEQLCARGLNNSPMSPATPKTPPLLPAVSVRKATRHGTRFPPPRNSASLSPPMS